MQGIYPMIRLFKGLSFCADRSAGFYLALRQWTKMCNLVKKTKEKKEGSVSDFDLRNFYFLTVIIQL